jgi:hypothetical protein
MADPQGNEGYVTEMDIRLFMRDLDGDKNYLLDDVEFSPEEIRTAMTHTVDRFNDTPPYIATPNGQHGYTITTFPWRSALIRGTVANLLFIAGHRFRRNALKYNVPGGVVADQEKAPEYDAAGQRLWDEYKAWVAHSKRAMNMEQGWAIVDGPVPGCRF